MSTSSYDELMKHLRCLKAENSHLHRELQINSSHLTKLEMDASTMKDRLAFQLHYGSVGESGAIAANNHTVGNEQDMERMTAQRSGLADAMQYGLCVSEEDDRLAQPSSYFEHSSTAFQIGEKSDYPAKHQHYKSGAETDCTAGCRNRPNEHGFKKQDVQNCCLNLSTKASESDRTSAADCCEVGNEFQTPFCPPNRLKAASLTTEDLEAPSTLSLAKKDVNSLSNQDIVSGQNVPTKLITIATQTTDVYLPDSSSVHDSFDWQNASGHQTLSTLYLGGWPLENDFEDLAEGSLNQLLYQDTASVMSFASSGFSSAASCKVQHQQCGTKVEMVYSLLSMLGTHDKDDMSRTLLAMSNSLDSCIAMRQSGCIPLLIQLLHGVDKDVSPLGDSRGSRITRTRAAEALHNIVHSNPDMKSARLEKHVLRLLEQIRAYCDQLHSPSDEEGETQEAQSSSVGTDLHHLVSFVASLMKLSFDEEHRQAICSLGGLQAVAELIELDQKISGNTAEHVNVAVRRYACMTLTNLTFGDGTNKALMCSHKGATRALALFLHSPSEDLCQVSASVLRNLSWRADPASKQILREVGCVIELVQAAMRVEKEATLKSILSALWNLSAHSSENKEDICAVGGALKFLVSTLTYQSPSNTHAVIEHGGGVLRNISSHIAVHEKYRAILRQHGCLQILLRHLESPSLSIVSNACGTLWNLSARCPEDQNTLWELGAVNKLRNLINSKHRMISMGSAAALKNLIMSRSERGSDERTFAMASPGLHVRSQRTLETEFESSNLSEAFGNSETFRNRPTRSRSQESQITTKLTCLSMEGESNKINASLIPKVLETTRSDGGTNVGRSESQDSVGSTHSDISHDRSKMLKINQNALQPDSSERLTESKNRSGVNVLSSNEKLSRRLARVHESKIPIGIQPDITKVHNSYFVKGPHSLESSPASSRRHPGSGGMSYTNPSEAFRTDFMCGSAGFVPVRTMQHLGSSGLAKKASCVSSDALAFSQLTPCMDKLHLTMQDLDQDQDEPINFSTKYVEVVHEPSDVASVPVSSASLMNQAALRGLGAPQAVISQQSTGHLKKAPHQVSGKMQLLNSTFTSAHQIPPGRMAQPVAIGPVGSSTDVDASGFISKRLMTQACHPSAHGRIIGGYPRYRKPELDLEASEQPTNYSIKFAECNEDEEHGFVERPVDYSTRYAEREASNAVALNLPQVQNAAYGFSDDTVTTFCTEGTPMNFLSTATSMNDLSCNGTNGAPRKTEFSLKANGNTADQTEFHLNADCKSVPGSQSTGHAKAAVVAAGKMPDDGKNRKTLPEENVFLDQVIQPPNLSPVYSYKDSNGTSSPYDKPKQYFTEGTPMYFSNASSLSNLQISETGMDESPGKQTPLPRPGIKSLPNIDENSALDGRKSDEMKQPTLANDGSSCAPMSHHMPSGTTKTVTFDNNNQIQETPLMFSRCSSLASLSSFDAHSFQSSVVSEYSRRASEVVSPSDLPDSPCDTMPPSPSFKTCNAKAAAVPADISSKPSVEETKSLIHVEPAVNSEDKCPEAVQPIASVPFLENASCDAEQSLQFSALSSPVIYADEGSSCAFSGRTSLSALTIDEDVEIPAKPLARVAIANSKEGSEPCTNKNLPKELEKVTEKAGDNGIDDDDDDDDLSVSEVEENILAEIINKAMPSKSSKRMIHCFSDGLLKKQVLSKNMPEAKQMPACGSGKITSSPSLGVLPVGAAVHQRAQFFCHAPEINETILYGCDSPRKYATEDTPLNFSHSGSLGDLSGNSDLASETVIYVEKPPGHNQTDTDDINSVVSSLSDSDEDLEQLLSQIIKSAMPQSKKQSSKNARTEKKSANNSVNSNSKRFEVLQQPKLSAQGSSLLVSGYPHFMNVCSELAADGIRTYETEGTPVKFSRSTSLSNLTIDSLDEGVQERRHAELENNEVRQLPKKADVLNISEDLVATSCRHNNTLAEHVGQDGNKIRLMSVGGSFCADPIDSKCVAENSDSIFYEDSSMAVVQNSPFLEFDSGEVLEISQSLDERFETSTASDAQIVEVASGDFSQPKLASESSQKTANSKTRSKKTRPMTHMSSTPKSSLLRAGEILSSDSKFSKSPASSGRRSPAGKSRSLSPAIRSQQTVKALTEMRTPSRSSSYNSTRSQPPFVSVAVSNDHMPQSMEASTNAQKYSSEVHSSSPRISPSSTSQFSRNSRSAISNVSAPQSFRASLGASKYQKPTANSAAGKTLNSGNFQKLMNKSGIQRQGNRLESVTSGCELIAHDDHPKPPVKEGTFTKDRPTLGCLVIEEIRQTDVFVCDALNSSQADTAKSTMKDTHTMAVPEMCTTEDKERDEKQFQLRSTVNNYSVKENPIDAAKAHFCAKAPLEHYMTDTGRSICKTVGKNKGCSETSLEKCEKDDEEKFLSSDIAFRGPSKDLSDSQPIISSVLVKTLSRRGSLTSSVADQLLLNEKESDPSMQSKKQGFGKLSSFWNKDKRSKNKNPQEVPSVKQIAALGSGKSPKSSRKSFPVARSKKGKKEENCDGEELSSVTVARDGLVRSCTYDGMTYEPSASNCGIDITDAVMQAEAGSLKQNCSEVSRQGDTVTYSIDIDNFSRSSTLEKNLNTGQKNGKKLSLYPWKRHSEDNSKEKSKEFSKEKVKENQRMKSNEKIICEPKGKSDQGTNICGKEVAESKASKKKMFHLLRR